MKKLFTILALATLLLAYGCETPEPDGVGNQTENPNGNGSGNNTADDLVFLNNSNTAPTMVSGGGMVSISFKTSYSWTITKDVDWLTTSLTEGDAGTTSFFISASENKNDSERKGTVFINLSNGATYKVVVTQESNDGIQHLVCQDNEILYTTKYNYIVEKDFSGASGSGFGESASTLCVDHEYIDTYGKITFNNDVTKLPNNAFANCASMEIIYLPNGVKSVGKNAFKYCTALHSIISINSVDNNKALVIDGCLCAVAPANLVNYTIPAGVTKIGAGAFSGCKTLQRVVIPEGVVEIEAGAFEDCENLTILDIPRSLTKFDGDIITGKCNEDITLIIPSDHPHLLLYTTSDNKPIELNNYTNVLLDGFDPDNGMGYVLCFNPEIYEYQFYKCYSLTSITIPDSVTSIGGSAFRECSRLASVTIPNSVTSIGNQAFENCSRLASVTIPISVTSIENGTFYGCSSLESVTIPDSVTSIGSNAFEGCSSLTSINIPNSVTSIGSNAFEGCSSLTSINIPNSVTSIGTQAFIGCTGELIVNSNIPRASSFNSGVFKGSKFTKVTIGKGVTRIGDYAFYECSSIAEVYCKPITPPTGGKGMFFGNASERKIYVPTESVDAYKSAQYWSDYSSYIVGYDF